MDTLYTEKEIMRYEDIRDLTTVPAPPADSVEHPSKEQELLSAWCRKDYAIMYPDTTDKEIEESDKAEITDDRATIILEG